MIKNFKLPGKSPSIYTLQPVPPHTKVLEALECEDYEKFEEELQDGLRTKSINLNRIYDAPVNQSLLDIACSSPGMHRFVELLITNGADVNSVNPVYKTTPLHLAVENSDACTVRQLLGNILTNVNTPDSKGNTPLHVAAILNKVRVIEFLLQHPTVKVNATNLEGETPLHTALIYNQEDSVLCLIKNFDVDLDEIRDNKGQTCRDIMRNKFPDIVFHAHIDDSKSGKGEDTHHTSLLPLLHSGDVDTFRMRVKADKSCLDKDNLESYTYLQYACEHGLPEVVKTLLNCGANPNGTCYRNSKPPIVIAIYRGHLNIVRTLLDHPATSYTVDDGTVLHAVLHGIMKYDDNPSPHHIECVEYLLDKINPDKLTINQPDTARNTVLHLAVRLNSPRIIRILLDKGAYIGYKNALEEMPVTRMNPEILESYLDDCISTNNLRHTNNKYEIIYNYNFIAPVSNAGGTPRSPGEITNWQEVISETEPLAAMSEVVELRPLLEHPVLTSFLNLKWYTIRKQFWISGLFYFLFWALLMAYTSIVILELCGTIKSDFKLVVIENLLRISTLVLCGILFLHDCVQFSFTPLKYLSRYENWIRILLVGFTIAVTFRRPGPTIDLDYESTSLVPPIASIAILLASTELILLIGRHPRLSNQTEMFKLVTFNFLKFLAWYLILLLAFDFSLFLLFKDKKSSKELDPAGNSTETNLRYFQNIGTTIFKSIIMMAGEFDVQNIPFSRYPLCSYVLFTLFVFFITIVLYNLLNGLAVSDIQNIKNDAKLIAIERRAKLITNMEKVAIGDPFLYLRIVDKLITSFHCAAAERTQQTRSKYINMFNARVHLFPYLLPDMKAHVSPNNENRVNFIATESFRKQPGTCTCFQQQWMDWYINPEVVKKSEVILKNKAKKADDVTDNINIRKLVADYKAEILKAVEESSKRTEESLAHLNHVTVEIVSLMKRKLES